VAVEFNAGTDELELARDEPAGKDRRSIDADGGAGCAGNGGAGSVLQYYIAQANPRLTAGSVTLNDRILEFDLIAGQVRIYSILEGALEEGQRNRSLGQTKHERRPEDDNDPEERNYRQQRESANRDLHVT
jgi:hypothetical protein